MSARRRRSTRDRRRRTLGQNFLVDHRLIDGIVGDLDLAAGESLVELGAGDGALTLPLALAGADVIAVEADPVWAARLRERVERLPGRDGGTVRVVHADLRDFRLPERSCRIVANLPFGMTTEVLSMLLDDPERGPRRVDLIVQFHVARKHATEPPVALRTASWAPWWTFELGRRIGRDAFRPCPSVDAAVLTIRRRDPPILPTRLAPTFRETLRRSWEGPPPVRHPSRGSRRRRG